MLVSGIHSFDSERSPLGKERVSSWIKVVHPSIQGDREKRLEWG